MSRRGPALVAALLILAGCSGFGRTILTPDRSRGGAPWVLPEGSYPTQRLFRARYEGREAEGDFRLIVQLVSPESYRIRASGGLPSRTLWELIVGEDRGALWLDHRERTYCWTPDADSLRLPALADLAVAATPRILLGRVPARPAGRVSRTDDGRFTFEDRSGLRWDGEVGPEGGLAWWALIEEGATRAWWRRREDGSSELLDQVEGHRLSWEEAVRETYSGPPIELEIPSGFREISCRGAEAPDLDG